MAGNNDEVYDKKPQRYAEDNVTQWWIWSLNNNNKCIGDDTKAAARQSLNCIKNKKI